MKKLMKTREHEITDYLDGLTIAQAVSELQKLGDMYGPYCRIDVGTKSYPYDSETYPTVFITYKTEETDEEYEQRVGVEYRDRERRKELYEQLKKEFEND